MGLDYLNIENYIQDEVEYIDTIEENTYDDYVSFFEQLLNDTIEQMKLYRKRFPDNTERIETFEQLVNGMENKLNSLDRLEVEKMNERKYRWSINHRILDIINPYRVNDNKGN